jgi:hypothetical protein
MWRRVDLVWTDASEECIASIFRAEISASEEPAWAGGCRLSHQSKTRSYIRIGREEEWATWEINRRERGRVCKDGRACSTERARTGIGSLSGGGGGSQNYLASIDQVASELSCERALHGLFKFWLGYQLFWSLWYSLWFSSVSLSKCWYSTLNYATFSFLHILFHSVFTYLFTI